MEEILYTGSVEDIAALVAAFKFPSQAYVLVESMPQHMVKERQNLLRLINLNRIDDLTELKNFTSGRVFDRDFELRWERVSGKTQVVFLGTKAVYQDTLRANPELTQNTGALQNLTSHPRYYYLFGQLLEADDRERMGIQAVAGEEYYAEVRIPRLLRYPDLKSGNSQKAQRVQLAVQEYVDKSTGRVKLFRFSGLRPAE
ncbi:MAG: type III-D CRISPR-associated protein Csx19 [Ktedonobacteraceae bacterium]